MAVRKPSDPLVGQVARIHPKTGSEKQATNADIITIMLLSNMSLRVPLDPLVQILVSPTSAVRPRVVPQTDSIQQQLEKRRKRLNVS